MASTLFLYLFDFVRYQDASAIFAYDYFFAHAYVELSLRGNTVETSAACVAFYLYYGQSVAHAAAYFTVGGEQTLVYVGSHCLGL